MAGISGIRATAAARRGALWAALAFISTFAHSQHHRPLERTAAKLEYYLTRLAVLAPTMTRLRGE